MDTMRALISLIVDFWSQPKLESFLNQRNRIPSVGRFDANFEQNLEKLLAQITLLIPSSSTSPVQELHSSALLCRNESGSYSAEVDEAEIVRLVNLVSTSSDPQIINSAAGDLR